MSCCEGFPYGKKPEIGKESIRLVGKTLTNANKETICNVVIF